MLDFLVSHGSEMAVAVGFFREGTKHSQDSHGVTSDLVREREDKANVPAAILLLIFACIAASYSVHQSMGSLCAPAHDLPVSHRHTELISLPALLTGVLPGMMG